MLRANDDFERPKHLFHFYREHETDAQPHFAFWTAEARDRLCAEALERCAEALEGKPLRVLSHDPRLLAQAGGRAAVEFGGWSSASGRHVPPAPAAAARLRR